MPDSPRQAADRRKYGVIRSMSGGAGGAQQRGDMCDAVGLRIDNAGANDVSLASNQPLQMFKATPYAILRVRAKDLGAGLLLAMAVSEAQVVQAPANWLAVGPRRFHYLPCSDFDPSSNVPNHRTRKQFRTRGDYFSCYHSVSATEIAMAIYISEAGDLIQQYQAALDEQAELIRGLAAVTQNPLAPPTQLRSPRSLNFTNVA